MSRQQRLKSTLVALFLAVAVTFGGFWPAHAESPPSVLPSGGGRALLDPSDTVLILLDHQTGLFQTVRDISIAELRRNTMMLAKRATMYGIPVITSASEPDGPNGPLMPEIQQAAPNLVYVPRKGEVNAWYNQEFVDTVRKAGRRTLVVTGVWTSVCVMFPALDAKAAGYKVYAVMDASGDPSELASRTTLARFVQAGVIPTSANAVLARSIEPGTAPMSISRSIVESHGGRMWATPNEGPGATFCFAVPRQSKPEDASEQGALH